MTAAEKQMNRDDLHAWKKYDNNQYAMIPGFTSQKQQAQIRPKKSPLGQSAKANDLHNSVKRLTSIEKEARLKRDQERLAAHGFSHLHKGNTNSQERLNPVSFSASNSSPVLEPNF